MRSLTFLNVAFLCFSFIVPSVDAKCCNNSKKTLDCGDGTLGTPCCGYGKCNAFCCNCPGVSVFRQIVEYSSTEYKLWTTTIVAPSDPVSGQVLWTCRDVHFTTSGPGPATTTVPLPTISDIASETNDLQPIASATSGPKSLVNYTSQLVDLYSSLEERAAWADEVRVFEDLSGGLQINGTGVVSKEQYLGFFNVPHKEIGTEHGQNVLSKFAMHDVNGDGYLDFEETQLRCDRHGCH